MRSSWIRAGPNPMTSQENKRCQYREENHVTMKADWNCAATAKEHQQPLEAREGK